MLVLTRRKNQSIVIGDDIIVTVLEVKGDQIRLGITAPRDVQVYREELLGALPRRTSPPCSAEGAAPLRPAGPAGEPRDRPPPPRGLTPPLPTCPPAPDWHEHRFRPVPLSSTPTREAP